MVDSTTEATDDEGHCHVFLPGIALAPPLDFPESWPPTLASYCQAAYRRGVYSTSSHYEVAAS